MAAFEKLCLCGVQLSIAGIFACAGLAPLNMRPDFIWSPVLPLREHDVRTLSHSNCISIRNFPRPYLKAAAKGRLPLFLDIFVWENAVRYQGFICELVWRVVAHP